MITKEEINAIEYSIKKLNEYQGYYIAWSRGHGLLLSKEQEEKDGKDTLKANVTIVDLVRKYENCSPT
ncbi:MAG TPA: hypothetical protein ENH85_09805 [Candidatus Scalindua sp.]|nr:hypothetical protein [Candidatus Scalindua sp.]